MTGPREGTPATMPRLGRMPDAPRRKPLLQWEPFPFLVTIVLLVATGGVRPEAPLWLLLPFLALLIASIVWLVIVVRRSLRPANPDAWGNLSTLEGLVVVQVPKVERALRTSAPVFDVHRHQASIELALLHGGAEQHAVLVPRSSRWLSRRYRIGVQLSGGGRPRHAGFLGDAAAVRWTPLLEAFLARGAYAAVPASIVGARRPLKVELDLAGLTKVEESGASGAQSAGAASD